VPHFELSKDCRLITLNTPYNVQHGITAKLTYLSYHVQDTSTEWNINRVYKQEGGYLNPCRSDIRLDSFKSQNKTILLELLPSWQTHATGNHANQCSRRLDSLSIHICVVIMKTAFPINNTNIFIIQKCMSANLITIILAYALQSRITLKS
jgi:hypothetical protein